MANLCSSRRDLVGNYHQRLYPRLESQKKEICVKYTDHKISMKELTTMLLASIFVLYCLIALLSVKLDEDSVHSPVAGTSERLSDVGLRLVFRR